MTIDQNRRLSVAPMMELTDRHFRFLARLLSRHALLYTEMLTSAAVIHGDRDYLLGKHPAEDPIALQLGGSDPDEMAAAAAIGQDWGYQEINVNVGCPSDRVKAGRFGACLMAEPELVRELVCAMKSAVSIPVTVKCRLGIDRDDSYAALETFVGQVLESGCQHFIVHARKAWLDGLSPKENRNLPPLRYEFVYRLKAQFPQLHISINGGIDSIDSAHRHLKHVDGVMVGRAAYYHPVILTHVDKAFFNQLPGGHHHEASSDQLAQVARLYADYMQGWVEQGVRLSAMSRHAVALFQNVPGARLWRRHISEQAGKCNNAQQLIEEALGFVTQPDRRSA